MSTLELKKQLIKKGYTLEKTLTKGDYLINVNTKDYHKITIRLKKGYIRVKRTFLDNSILYIDYTFEQFINENNFSL